MSATQDRIALLVSGFKTGGDTRVVLNLAEGLAAQNLKIDLVLASAAKLTLENLSPNIRVIDLQTQLTTRTASAIKLLLPLARYLRREKPAVLISNLIFTNAIAVLAKGIAAVPLRLILVEHVTLSRQLDRPDEPQSRLIPFLMRSLYPFATAVVTVGSEMAQQLADLKLKENKLKVIHNPVINPTLKQKAQEPLDHPWLQPGQPPVLIGVGRFATQKDFSTLLRAFAILQQQRSARLIILGEGPLQKELDALVEQLALTEVVAFPGFVANPYAYLSRAAVFVLSSRWEALPTALIEAMSCGCQIVATDCPYGPREILAAGEYGWLVPVENASALAEAMQQALVAPIAPESLRERAELYSVDRAVSSYLSLINH